jgi:hypothetical protein
MDPNIDVTQSKMVDESTFMWLLKDKRKINPHIFHNNPKIKFKEVFFDVLLEMLYPANSLHPFVSIV